MNLDLPTWLYHVNFTKPHRAAFKKIHSSNHNSFQRLKYVVMQFTETHQKVYLFWKVLLPLRAHLFSFKRYVSTVCIFFSKANLGLFSFIAERI